MKFHLIIFVLLLLFSVQVYAQSPTSQNYEEMNSVELEQNLEQVENLGITDPQRATEAIALRTGAQVSGSFEGVRVEGEQVVLSNEARLEARSLGQAGVEIDIASDGSLILGGDGAPLGGGIVELRPGDTMTAANGIISFDGASQVAQGVRDTATDESQIIQFSGPGSQERGLEALPSLPGNLPPLPGNLPPLPGDLPPLPADLPPLTGFEAIEVQGAAIGQDFVQLDEVESASFSFGSNDVGEAVSQITFSGGTNIRFQNGLFTADYLQSLVRDQSVTTEITGLSSAPASFFVADADSFQVGCLQVSALSQSFIQVQPFVTIDPTVNSTAEIRDCSFHDYLFEGEGGISMTQGQNPSYRLTDGKLTRTNPTKLENVNSTYTEAISTISDALIETDIYGITCILFFGPGSYFYIDEVQERDFVVEIPENASQYKLCLRKSPEQEFVNATGTIDFVDKEAELNERVIFKKYPIRNDKVADLLTTPLLEQTTGNTFLDFDDDLIHFSHIKALNDQDEIEPLGTQVFANNYYHITEWNTGLDHKRLLTLYWELPIINDDFTDFYSSEADLPYVVFYQNILTQDNGDSAVTIYPPNHREINELLQ